jgi:hypothetical protein
MNEQLRDIFNDWVELRQDFVTLSTQLNARAAQVGRVLKERGDGA